MTDLSYEERKCLRRAAEDARDACNPHYGPFVEAVAHPLRILALLDMADRAAEPTAQDRKDAEVTAYALPGGVSVERCMQLNGTYLWAIRDSFKNCLSKSGEWGYEPFPSSRTEDWLAQNRFDSANAAIDAARAERRKQAFQHGLARLGPAVSAKDLPAQPPRF